MFQTIAIVILLGIIIYLIFDKKGIKTDDVKAFLKNIGIKTKEKISVFFEKVKSCFQKLRTRIEEFKQKRAESKRRQDELNKQIELHKQKSVDSMEENPDNLPSVIETSDNGNESVNDSREIKEETITESNLKSRKNEKGIVVIGVIIGVIGVFIFLDLLIYDFTDYHLFAVFTGLALFIFLMIKFRWFRRLILFVLILCICMTPFAYKKTMLDYDGEYATDRFVYTEEFGFCMLTTYYPNYQSGNAKGIAVTNIPFEALFSVEILASKYENDPADSKDLLDSYQILATLGDNALVDSLAKLFLDSKISTRSIQIGKYGNYFATKFDDFISKSNSKNSYEEIDGKDLLSDSVEEDYSPILIRP